VFNKFKFLNVDKNMSCIKPSAVLQVAIFSEDCGGGHVFATCAGYHVVYSYTHGAVW